jgi:hypothetical protein
VNQLYDLLGSIIIGGIVLLMLTAFNGNVMEGAGNQFFKTAVQTNLTNVTNIIENDFRKMGYRVSPTQDSSIIYADSNKITFKGDFNDDGVIDTLQYYIDTVRAYLMPNPRTKVLHRKLNSLPPQDMYIGATTFRLQYYKRNDSLMTNSLITATPVAATSKIKSVKLSMSIESPYHFLDNRNDERLSNPWNDTTYAGVYWERNMKPVNLR